MTTSYVLVERARSFREGLAPLLPVIWIGPELHEGGLDLLLERSRRKLSLVDATSFLAMRRHGLDEVFAFDEDFEAEGFHLAG